MIWAWISKHMVFVPLNKKHVFPKPVEVYKGSLCQMNCISYHEVIIQLIADKENAPVLWILAERHPEDCCGILSDKRETDGANVTTGVLVPDWTHVPQNGSLAPCWLSLHHQDAWTDPVGLGNFSPWP